ncbi:hypothetical protein D0839_05945 [Bordetella avium]|nr:hypothetical protein D0839_05945 [Bordetella avium]
MSQRIRLRFTAPDITVTRQAITERAGMGICCHRMEVTRGVTFKHRKQCAATAIFIIVVCSTFWADGNPINRTSANRFNFDDGQGENTMDVGSVLKAVVHIAPLKYLWPRNSTEELARCITQEKAIRMRATLGQTARNTSPCSAPLFETSN